MLKINSNVKIKSMNKLTFAFLLIALFAVSMLPPFALAQVGVPSPTQTRGYISVAPTLVGVGQSATVNLWVYPIPVSYDYRAYFPGFSGISVTFTKPDGTTDTFMPVDGTNTLPAGNTETVGSIFFFYEPDMAGNWSVTMSMPAQNITNARGSVNYTACTSNPAYFTVQTEPVLAGLLNGYPWAELPNANAYWRYPINGNNREWSAISGDWLQWNVGAPTAGTAFFGITSNEWQPYGTAPNTGHIVWDSQSTNGGLIGGQYGGLSYAQTTINSVNGVVIMEGKVFQNIPNSGGRFRCIDLATGEVLYTASGTFSCGIHIPGNALDQAASFGQGNNIVLESSHGSNYTPYLFGTNGSTWNYYDPFTGALVRSIVNASSARLVDGTNFAYGTASGNLTAWNMTRVANNNWPTGIMWTTPLPTAILGGTPGIFAISSDGSTIVCRTNPYQFFGFSATNGALLWNRTMDFTAVQNCAFYLVGVDSFVVFGGADATFHCYSILTGAEQWTSRSFSDSPWASTWTVYSAETNDYDNVYLAFPDGTMAALSIETGEQVWRSTAIPSTEYTNNAVPFVSGMLLASGNIYAYGGYSVGYQINPIPRQAMLVCVNATTGNITYTLNGAGYPLAASAGNVITLGTYDGVNYCIGKGQTSTSIEAPLTGITAGTAVTIQGNVLDQSPAQPGTPAVADSAMSEWMDYLHMQNATLLNNPPKEPGVPVTLTAVDPNGNTITIATVTTDSAGTYGYSFIPTNPGMYTITATFAGSNSYWPSTSETKITVVDAPQATPTTPTTTTNPPYELYTVGMGVAVIVALAVAVLLLRKKP